MAPRPWLFVVLGATLALGGCGNGDPSAESTNEAVSSIRSVAVTAPASALEGRWLLEDVVSEAGPGKPWFSRLEIIGTELVYTLTDGTNRQERYHLGEGRDADGTSVLLLCRDGQLPWVVRQTGDHLVLIEDVVGGYTYRLARAVRG